MALLSRRVLHRGSIGSFGVDEIELPNGRRTTLAVLRHPGAAAAVAVTGAREVLLLRQYRHPAGGWLWEIPAGKLHAAETPVAGVVRELEEETGWRARRVERIGEIVTAPGFTDERIHLFIASDLERGIAHRDHDEEIEVHPVALADAFAMIDRGEIVDAKTIVALFLSRPRLEALSRSSPV